MPPPISGSKFCLICELCSLDLRFALRFVVCKLFVRRAIDWFLDKPYIGWQEWTFITSWFAIFVKFGPVFFLKRFKSMMKKLFQPKIKCHIYTHHTQISLWRSIWLLYLRKKLLPLEKVSVKWPENIELVFFGSLFDWWNWLVTPV